MRATEIESELQLTKVCTSWEDPSWEELDWSRIKLLSIRDTLEARDLELHRAKGAQCLECPSFVKHVCSHELPSSRRDANDGSFQCVTMNG